jgi:hypothetical protein
MSAAIRRTGSGTSVSAPVHVGRPCKKLEGPRGARDSVVGISDSTANSKAHLSEGYQRCCALLTLSTCPHVDFNIFDRVPSFFPPLAYSSASQNPQCPTLDQCLTRKPPGPKRSPGTCPIRSKGSTHSSHRLSFVLLPSAPSLISPPTLIMLALTSPISSLHSTYEYSSAFAPGVQFALDLTDNNAAMSEKGEFVFSGAQEDAATLRALTEGSSPFTLQG